GRFGRYLGRSRALCDLRGRLRFFLIDALTVFVVVRDVMLRTNVNQAIPEASVQYILYFVCTPQLFDTHVGVEQQHVMKVAAWPLLRLNESEIAQRTHATPPGIDCTFAVESGFGRESRWRLNHEKGIVRSANPQAQQRVPSRLSFGLG